MYTWLLPKTTHFFSHSDLPGLENTVARADDFGGTANFFRLQPRAMYRYCWEHLTLPTPRLWEVGVGGATAVFFFFFEGAGPASAPGSAMVASQSSSKIQNFGPAPPPKSRIHAFDMTTPGNDAVLTWASSSSPRAAVQCLPGCLHPALELQCSAVQCLPGRLHPALELQLEVGNGEARTGDLARLPQHLREVARVLRGQPAGRRQRRAALRVAHHVTLCKTQQRQVW